MLRLRRGRRQHARQQRPRRPRSREPLQFRIDELLEVNRIHTTPVIARFNASRPRWMSVLIFATEMPSAAAISL